MYSKSQQHKCRSRLLANHQFWMILAQLPALSSLSRYDRLTRTPSNLSTKGLRTSQAICTVFPSATALFTGCQRQQNLIKKNTVINLITAMNLGKSTQASHLINQPLQSRLAPAKMNLFFFFPCFPLFHPPCAQSTNTQTHKHTHRCITVSGSLLRLKVIHAFICLPRCGLSLFHCCWTFGSEEKNLILGTYTYQIRRLFSQVLMRT